jgi:hypothetical protein
MEAISFDRTTSTGGPELIKPITGLILDIGIVVVVQAIALIGVKGRGGGQIFEHVKKIDLGSEPIGQKAS